MGENAEENKSFFGSEIEVIEGKKWNWKSFKTTEGFPIPKDLLSWVIGQNKALEETKLCIDEWVEKLLYLMGKKWWRFWDRSEYGKPKIYRCLRFIYKDKKKELRIPSWLRFPSLRKKHKKSEIRIAQHKEWLPAGPFLLLLGDAGTGKSLIGRALSTYMTKLYKKKGIELNDVLSWENKMNPSSPKVSIHPSPKGKELVIKLKKKEAKKGLLKRLAIKAIQGLLIGLGSTFMGITLYNIVKPWIFNDPVYSAMGQFLGFAQDFGLFNYLRFILMANAQVLMIGGSLLLSGFFIYWIGKMMTGNLTGKSGIGGAEATKAPKLLVDNSDGIAPFVDATGHGSAQLFGSIAWDPYQTGGLGTPEHQRVTVGDVHRAHLGILYIDEIKNLHGQEAVTLLTVLEDGQLPVALRSQWHGGDTAAMAVSTEPVPCMNFFIAAGNMDSVPQIHHALMDRIAGYGKIVYMNNDMPNNVENRRKCIQFISQEIKRFNLLPFTREACIEIIEESRRKSGRKDRLVTKFRPLISIIKTASIIALNKRSKVVEAKDVREAINEHCKSIHRQVLERFIETKKVYAVINPDAKPKIGQIHGIGVTSSGDSREIIGSVLPIRASIQKTKKKQSGYFHITGVRTDDDTWVQQSILKVRHVITQLYNEDPEDSRTHIDFAQQVDVDGPSAGVAMTLALISIIENKPLRQDVAVTGEVNIGVGKKILITPIGGTHEKIMAAQRLGFKKVLVPQKNYEYDIIPKDYKITVIGCQTLRNYMENCLITPKDLNS